MKNLNYPDLIDHIHIHSDFMSKVKKYNDDHKTGKTILNREIMDELMNWLLDHILEEDQKYNSYQKSKSAS